MKALITGITGFVGSHLADYLIDKEGVEVHGIRRPRSRAEFTRPDVHYHEGDVTDKSSVTDVVLDVVPDYIFHLAAQSFVPLSWAAPQATLTTNIIGTLNILETVRELEGKAIVLIAGSSEEYGLVDPDECPITESQPLRPQSPYGVSKVAADLLTQQYHRSYGLKTIITRAFNHTGPRRGEQFITSRLAKMAAAIELDQADPIMRLGNLDAIRDWTDVRDMVKAYWLAINQCPHGRPYNIGSNIGHSVSEIAQIMTHFSPKIKGWVSDPSLMRPSDVPRLIANSTAFREISSWKPEIPFEQTLRDLFIYWKKKLEREGGHHDKTNG